MNKDAVLKNRKIYISLLFSALLAVGISLSTLHSHNSHHHKSDTGHSLVVDHNLCVICGSVFQIDNFTLESSEIKHYSENSLYTKKTAKLNSSLSYSQFGRAPPLS